MAGVLTGIRVLDFGRYVAGPYCAALLGDLGADVIRVERRAGGEDRFLAPVTADGTGALYLQLNRSKRGMTLDARKPGGAELQRRLVASADVVVANLPPRALAAMGLDYEALRRVRPDVVLTTVTAFGTEGPWRDKLGFDSLAQAVSGNFHFTGTAGVPTRSFAPYCDFGTASLAAFGTLAALMHRARTGEGQHVEGTLLATGLTHLNGALIEQDQLGLDREATHNRNPWSGPADTFATRDGWVVCMAIGPAQFERWCGMVGAPELLSDERFADDTARAQHGEILSARMAAWCAERTTDEALDAMERAAVPGGPVYAPRQVLEDAHVRAERFLEPIDYPTASRPTPIAGFPLRLSATPGAIHRRAPELGEHTNEILGELGYDAADIEKLRSDEAV